VDDKRSRILGCACQGFFQFEDVFCSFLALLLKQELESRIFKEPAQLSRQKEARSNPDPISLSN